ncbi:MAG: hypothetical protein D6698_16465 [Gammaproteobacteria bacterium]|nr:MAG: hypothetical protein D6698_16465 [Gammaproteobacteria bacterium]
MGSTDQGYPGNILLTGPWSIPCALHNDELLSSWLVRSALANGCDPLTLTGDLWPGWRAWTIDLDRGLPADKLKSLAKKCTTTTNKFESIFLRHAAARVVGAELPIRQCWPWILAIGARNRLRSGGLQYCPICLKESPYFRICWRFAWHTCCSTHHIRLHDSCPHCSISIEPHRLEAQNKSITVCPNCLSDLSEASTEKPSEKSLSFQKMANRTLDDGYNTYSNVKLRAPAWFELARFFYVLSHRLSNPESPSMAALASYFGVKDTPKHAPQLERADTATRASLFGVVELLMNTNKKKLASILTEHGISQEGFCPKGVAIPGCLVDLLEALESRPQKKKGRSIVNSLPNPRPWHEVQRRSIRIRRKLMEGK